MFVEKFPGEFAQATWPGQVKGPDPKFENKISASGPIQKIQPFLRAKHLQKACFFPGSSPLMRVPKKRFWQNAAWWRIMRRFLKHFEPLISNLKTELTQVVPFLSNGHFLASAKSKLPAAGSGVD
jgi:hypothetical protein